MRGSLSKRLVQLLKMLGTGLDEKKYQEYIGRRAELLEFVCDAKQRYDAHVGKTKKVVRPITMSMMS